MTIFLIVLAVIALFVLVLAARAAAFKPKAVSDPPAEGLALDGDMLTDHLAQMIRIPTVSNPDHSKIDEGAFDAFRALLERLYPNVYKTCAFERIGRTGLCFKWSGRTAEAPVVLMAHYDVVPVTEERWEHPPFCGEIFDGELWGRGTTDTKITLLGTLESAEALITEGFIPAHDIYMAFSGEEEISGPSAADIVSALEQRGIKPALVLDEGGAIVDKVFPGVTRPIAVVGIGEKGFMDARLTAKSTGGHASTPPAHSAVGILAKAIVACENHPFKATLTTPVRELFSTVGPYAPFGLRMLFANMWAFGWIIPKLAPKLGSELNAMMRTTMAFTMAQGSKQANVLPNVATSTVNMRLVNTETCAGAIARMNSLINDENVTVEMIYGMEASPYADPKCEGYGKLAAAIRQTWGGEVVVSPYLMIACSDSRHYNRICDNVFKFSAMQLSKEQRGRIHNDNERLPVADIPKTVEFYTRFIRSL